MAGPVNEPGTPDAPGSSLEPVVAAADAVEAVPAKPVPQPLSLLREEKTFPRRFAAALLVLGVLVGAAVAGAIVLALHHESEPAPFVQGAAPGSKAFEMVGPTGGWRPVCDVEFGCDRPHQIAAYVAPKYVLADGKDAVAILSGTPTIANSDGSVSAVGAIIERNDRGSRIVYTDSTGDNTVQYSLCGFGTACALTGTPSVQRGDLLRRQALELALLTFKYDTAVKSTLVFFPKPAKSTDTAYALFFRRADYGAQLERPLADTLGKQVVLRPAGITEALAQKIGDITAPRVFKFEYRSTQQGLPVLVLTPAAY